MRYCALLVLVFLSSTLNLHSREATQVKKHVFLPADSTEIVLPDFVTMQGKPAPVKTRVTVGRSATGLELTFECEDREVIALKNRPRDHEDAWKDDCVEIFLDIGHKHHIKDGWRHLLITAAGRIYDDVDRDVQQSIEGATHSVTRTATGWTATMSLPWKALGGRPTDGTVWGFNVTRSNYPQGQHMSFSPTYRGFARVDQWGHLLFTPEADATPILDKLSAFHADRSFRKSTGFAPEKNPFPQLKAGKKQASVFWTPKTIASVRKNLETHPNGARLREAIVARAAPWLAMDNEELWGLMFAHTIDRSHMVYSNGHCPNCKKPVPMYQWKIDAVKLRWKVECPHCAMRFPCNDFKAYHDSGLDSLSRFDPKKADRGLLFNADHPDPKDPLHRFGVDDGFGYTEGKERWRFIGTYLTRGQWSQLILPGVENCADAYLVTGNRAYARKAMILIDRIADLFPDFDYRHQGWVYEKKQSRGYVFYHINSAHDVRRLVQAYDRIFDAVQGDPEVTAFCSQKARALGLENQKRDWASIRKNVEERIFIDALNHIERITTNYPQTEMGLAFAALILLPEKGQGAAMDYITDFIRKGTAADGITGEKGLANYSTFSLRQLAQFLGELSILDPELLPRLIRDVPSLKKTFKFHMDTLCLDGYYPQAGDSGWFAKREGRYGGALFTSLEQSAGLTEKLEEHGSFFKGSSHTAFWEFYKATKDPAYLQQMVLANGGKTESLPHDLRVSNPEAVQDECATVVAKHGPRYHPTSINFEEWGIGILRSGQAESRRAAWLHHFSVSASHTHFDSMNLGLFAYGLDLMPDMGYPPVQFGGWDGPKANWYRFTPSHNTVTVDRKNQPLGNRWSITGETLSTKALMKTVGTVPGASTQLWSPAKPCQFLVGTAPHLAGKQYERTVAQVDIDADSFYLLDLFRVKGGQHHAKFFHSHFGTITSQGLNLNPGNPFNSDPSTQMRNYQTDPSPETGWSVTWDVENRYKIPTARSGVKVRYTDLTRNASATLCEGWVTMGGYDTTEQTWIPRVITQRENQNSKELASTFVAVIEPYVGKPSIAKKERVDLVDAAGNAYGDAYTGLVISLTRGETDIFLSANQGGDETATAKRWQEQGSTLTMPTPVQTDSPLLWLRQAKSGGVTSFHLCGGTRVSAGTLKLTLKQNRKTENIAGSIADGLLTLTAGNEADVISATVSGEPLKVITDSNR